MNRDLESLGILCLRRPLRQRRHTYAAGSGKNGGKPRDFDQELSLPPFVAPTTKKRYQTAETRQSCKYLDQEDCSVTQDEMGDGRIRNRCKLGDDHGLDQAGG